MLALLVILSVLVGVILGAGGATLLSLYYQRR